MNYDIITIGSAVLDVHVKSKDFTVAPVRHKLMVCEIYGGKMAIDAATISSGGAATNTAVSFARQGFVVGCIAGIGVDVAAQVVWDDLHRDGVHTRLLVQMEKEPTGISALMVAADGSRSALVFRGASHLLKEDDIPFAKISNVRAIHLSALGETGLVQKIGRHAREHNIFFSWNPSKTEAEEIFLKQVVPAHFADVLFLNDLEWDAVKQVENKVIASAKIVVVTRGDKGGEIYTEGKKITYDPTPVKQVVCTTGAGDAFASGFVGAHLRGMDLKGAVEFGAKNAASVVGYMGAKQGLLTLSNSATG